MAATNGKTKKRRVFVVDDHPVVRDGLRGVIEQQSDLMVCGEAAEAAEALANIPSAAPDLVLVDLSLAHSSGLDLLKDLVIQHPAIAIIVLSMHDEMIYADRVLRAGARGYLMKTDAERHIVTAVEALLHRQPFFSAQISETVLEGFLRSGRQTSDRAAVPRLTPREREVIQLLAEGHRNKEIAQILRISIKTVETHRNALMRKIGVKSIVELVRYAVRNHLTEA